MVLFFVVKNGRYRCHYGCGGTQNARLWEDLLHRDGEDGTGHLATADRKGRPTGGSDHRLRRDTQNDATHGGKVRRPNGQQHPRGHRRCRPGAVRRETTESDRSVLRGVSQGGTHRRQHPAVRHRGETVGDIPEGWIPEDRPEHAQHARHHRTGDDGVVVYAESDRRRTEEDPSDLVVHGQIGTYRDMTTAMMMCACVCVCVCMFWWQQRSKPTD